DKLFVSLAFFALFQRWKKGKTILSFAISNCPKSNLLHKYPSHHLKGIIQASLGLRGASFFG
ncbi:MAG: hypothetical protein ACI81S_001091, partial [Sphingobacteriales bacterium]